ncbi:pecanex-like protein 4 [Ptychodera flava]|uniref:pecanex-like protein 4 n=1 Tax=Ptychodera flava TaxID=63121 RepID=UPI00396A99A3
MGNGVPLLNDYKQEFFWKRFPQTVLGGPKVKIGYDAPAYVYINQIILFLIPWLIGGIFTSLVAYNVVEDYVGVCICGGCVFVYVLTVQIVSLVVRSKKSTVSRVNPQNVLAEDDEIEFESCFGVETIEFIIPGKKFKINIFIHALLSGPLCGVGMWYLLPATLNGLYSNNTAATVILFIFGWLTLCIAQYSLTVGPPPEPAVFHSTDTYEITPLMRPFYVFVFEAFFLVARSYSSFVTVDQVLHIIFPFLPVFWILGFLPPLDALLPWLGDQILVFLLGGSHMAGDVRLLCIFLVSSVAFVIVFLIAHFAESSLAAIITAACIGFVLSLDLVKLTQQLTTKCQKKKGGGDAGKTETPESGFGWIWGWKEFLVYMVALVFIGVVSGLCHHYSAETSSTLYDVFGYTIIGLLVIVKLLTDSQTVFVIFGLLRNRLYPTSTHASRPYLNRKRKLHKVGYIRRLFLDIVSPAVMLVYLSLYLAPSSMTLPSDAWKISLGSVRALRWIWQDTTHSLLEISIAHIINIATEGSSSSWWTSLGLGLQLTVIGLCRDRFYQLIDQLYFVCAVLITSYSEKKQRRSTSLALIIISICIFPIILAIVCLAVALAAPVLPLFTLPIFLLGFPRPLRSWPEPVGSSANTCADSVYYKQVAPQLASSLRKSLADGSLGNIHPGDHYLCRFQDRMVWLQVLEKGYGYCTFSMKGLEMQETSCHTIEAGRVDEIFETAFELEEGSSCCNVNKYPLHTLTALEAVPVYTYSDARNVLTGIIDSPDTLRNVGKCFLQSLVWVLLHHNAKTTNKKRKGSAAKSIKEVGKKNEDAMVHAVSFNDTWQSSGQDSGKPDSVDDIRPQSQARSIKSWKSSINSLDSWGDDNDSLALEPIDTKKDKKMNLVSGFTTKNTQKALTPTKQTTRKEAELPGLLDMEDDDMEDLFKELDYGMPVMDATGIGMPVVDARKGKQDHAASFGLPAMNSMMTGGIRLAGSMQFNSPYSSKLSLPLKWREIPIEKSKITSLLKEFPTDWYKHVLSLLDLTASDKNSDEIVGEVTGDSVLADIYTQLVVACYAVVNVLGVGGTDAVSMGASHVYKVYTGDVPWSPSLEWLNEDEELLQLVLKAYRYGFKLAYDQAVLGEIESHEELAEYLQEYENDWYIGCEKDEAWSTAVLQGKTSLFSLVYDAVDGVYNGRVLSKQQVMAYIGRLNGEVVRGYWASLAQELFYFTNDDEERYSIQAHPVLLRNLTVQSADPPLGYPIYSSPPISIPTL